MTRNEVIAAIKASLKARGLRYSVTGGRGTAYGWITVDLLPAWFKNLSEEKIAEEYRRLNEKFGLSSSSSISIPSGNDYYREYMDRAAGRIPSVLGKPYWD